MSDEHVEGTAGAPETPTGKTVAYENFDAVVKAKRGLESQLAEMRAQVQTLTERASAADQWRAKAEEAEARYGAYVELGGAIGSTDPDVLGVFDQRYRSLPEANRPSRADWLAGLKAAPDTAPALLRPWLAPAAASKPAAPPAPRVPGTPATPPATPAQVSDAEIAAVRERAVATGDWSEWKRLRSVIGVVR